MVITDGAHTGAEWFVVEKVRLADPDLDRQRRYAGCGGLGHSAVDARGRLNPRIITVGQVDQHDSGNEMLK